MVALFNVLGPILIITAIGYGLERLSAGLHIATLGTLVLLVATPSLIFHTLVSMHVDPAILGEMSVAALLAMSISALFGLVALYLTGTPQRAYLPSLVFPNSGNMGLALTLLTFGDEGMKLGVAYFFTVSIVQHSVGFSISSGSVNLRRLSRQPLLYAVGCVLLVTLLDIQVPRIILTTTEMLGGIMIPAMLIVLGASLATLKVADLGPAIVAAAARLVFGVASALLVIWLLDFSGVAAGTVFLLATMPIAIVNHIYALQNGPYGPEVSGAVAMSTLLTFMCLPALIWVALWISGHG